MFTVLGGNGFIGTHLIAYLRQKGHDVFVPNRDLSNIEGRNLGHVIYTIGFTGNFRQHLHETIWAQIGLFSKFLQSENYDSCLYCSSTRLYSGLGCDQTVSEEHSITLKPSLDAVYDGSKLLAESLCLGLDRPNLRVARLSNIYGKNMSPQTFLGAVLKEATQTGTVEIGEDALSSKDYIFVDDIIPLLESIALHGKYRIYNLAAGKNIAHATIANELVKYGYEVRFAKNGLKRCFPKISIQRIQQEFDFTPRFLTDEIEPLIGALTAQN